MRAEQALAPDLANSAHRRDLEGFGRNRVTRPQLLDRAYFGTRKRSIVTGPDCVLLNGSRSILPRPEVEKRTPSPSSTGKT